MCPRRLTLCLFLLLPSLATAIPSGPVHETPPFLPAPLEFVQKVGQAGFSLSGGIRIDATLSHHPMGRALIRAFQAAGLPVLPEEEEGDVSLSFTGNNTANPEWYKLEVTPHSISICLHHETAMPLIAQTLAQAVVKDANGSPAIPALRLEDEPLFAHRGLMLDCARHPLGVETIKKMLRVMARYKFNRLHWHLTDDQGWRLEIHAYPRLTQVGSCRPSTAIYPDNSQQDGVPINIFYSQKEVREIVDYAHRLGIIIIPEIEIPGHASAAIASYPELGNEDAPGFMPTVATTWGIFPTVLAPRQETFRFISTVLAEVCELFPLAPYIHCGGDECPHVQWQNSPKTRDFMVAHGMKSPAEVQHYFTHYCAAELEKHGRSMVGWDEIQQAPKLPANAIVMVWHGRIYEQAICKAIHGGHDIIASPNSHCYLNFGHEVWAKDPFYRAYVGSYKEKDRDWQQLYRFNPIPPELTNEQQKRIIGVQGNAWGEVIPNARKLEYMVFPRLLALAEVAWRPAELRHEDDFRPRLLAQYPYLDSEGINFREEDGTPRCDRKESTGR